MHYEKYGKKYYEKNKAKVLKWQADYRAKNKETIRAKDAVRNKKEQVRRRAASKARYQEKKHEWREEYLRNRTRRLAASKERYQLKSGEIIQASLRRRRGNPQLRILHNLGGCLRTALKVHKTRKNSRTKDIIGCGADELRAHLEKQFQPGMSWENYGDGWHIDHIVPVAAFDLRCSQQQAACFHFSNLRPLWAQENLRRNKVRRPKYE